MSSSIESHVTFTTSHLYLFPVFPELEIDLAHVLMSVRLDSAGSATLRLALYRQTNRDLLLDKERTTLASRLAFDLVTEPEVRFFEFEAAAYTSRAAITNTTGWFRVMASLDRVITLHPETTYAVAVAPAVASIRMAAPTSLVDQPGFQATSQNPGVAPFPRSPTINTTVRTPTIKLLSRRGAAALGG